MSSYADAVAKANARREANIEKTRETARSITSGDRAYGERMAREVARAGGGAGNSAYAWAYFRAACRKAGFG